jgi:hypothetical protein
MESAMQQILEALGQMEERLTAMLGGRSDTIEQRSTKTVANLRGDRVGLGAGARVVVDNFSFDSFQGPTTSSVAAPMYDDDVFGSSATSAYDDEFGSSATSAYDDVFATIARFAAPSPCHDDDLLGAFGIFIPNREALNGKATAHNRFDTVPRMESESESEFLTSLAAQAPSVEEAMVATADAGSPARLNPLPNTDEEEEEVLTITPTKCSTIDLNRGIYSVPNPILHRQHLLRDCDDNHVGVDVDILLTSEFDEGPIFDEEPCFHRNLLDSDPDSPYEWVVPVIAVHDSGDTELSHSEVDKVPTTAALPNLREKICCWFVDRTKLSRHVRLIHFSLPLPDQALGISTGTHVFDCTSVDGKSCMRSYMPTSKEDEVLATTPNRCLMNCFILTQNCFLPPVSCSWDAVMQRQPWPPPMQFQASYMHNIKYPFGCGWDAMPHKQPWPPPVFHSLMYEEDKGNDSDFGDIHVSVREGATDGKVQLVILRDGVQVWIPPWPSFSGDIQQLKLTVLSESEFSPTLLSDLLSPQFSGVQIVGQPLMVKVAIGQVFQCTCSIPEATWSMSDCPYVVDLKSLTFSFFALVVGMDWWQRHSLMKVDWDNMWTMISYNGSTRS